MINVVGDNLNAIEKWFELAAVQAEKATCLRSKCGTVIIKDNSVIGEGYNSPPLDDESQRKCGINFDTSKKPKYDLTCCVHAEWRAILDACTRHPDKIKGSRLYFMRIDESSKFTEAGKPFCTVCSRLAMESGITEFALWNKHKADIYSTDDYNKQSYAFYDI